MNAIKSVEKLSRIIKKESVDSHFAMPLVSGFTASLAQIPLNQYFRDSRQMAECQISSWEKLQYDAVHSIIDPTVEAESLGCKLEFPENGYPYN